MIAPDSSSQLHVNVASASPASPNASATGNDNFVFAPDLEQKAAVDFSGGAAENHAVHAGLSADLNQIFGPDAVVSTNATSDAGAPREAAVDLLGLFGLHATDHAHFVF